MLIYQNSKMLCGILRIIIDRLNKLIPMEILMPLGGAGFVGHELNKE